MVVFSLFFGTLAKVPSEGIPYPLFSYAAIPALDAICSRLTRASTSLVGESNLIQKVYFPRLILPLAGIISPLVDFLIAFMVLLGLMFHYHYYPGINMLS